MLYISTVYNPAVMNPLIKDINCYLSDDDNRIVLKPLADVSDCQRDYINACYVDVSLGHTNLIFCFSDFPGLFLAD